MNRQQAHKMAEDALKGLADALEAGKSEALTRYLAAMARFRRYSWANVMLIVTQYPDATHVGGFRTWKSLGRYVRQGEKGIAIIAPIVVKKAPEPDRENEDPLRGFRVAHVFDISQTEGEPLPELSHTLAGDPGTYTERLKELVAGEGIDLRYAEDLGGAHGSSAGGVITLLEGRAPAEEFSTLAHEVAHELLHRGPDRPESKTIRETEAEAVAYVVSSAIGLDLGAAAADYIQLHRGGPETLAQSLGRIQATAARILTALEAAQ